MRWNCPVHTGQTFWKFKVWLKKNKHLELAVDGSSRWIGIVWEKVGIRGLQWDFYAPNGKIRTFHPELLDTTLYTICSTFPAFYEGREILMTISPF